MARGGRDSVIARNLAESSAGIDVWPLRVQAHVHSANDRASRICTRRHGAGPHPGDPLLVISQKTLTAGRGGTCSGRRGIIDVFRTGLIPANVTGLR